MSRFECHGVMGTEADGVFLTEEAIPTAQVLGSVKAVSQRQNRRLDDLKRALAKQVKSKGGNACVEFSYAQKATIFSFSDTQWTATGHAALVG